MKFRNLTVTTSATTSRLTTLAQLKASLGLGDDLDSFYESVIDFASDEIAVYLGRMPDDQGLVSLGRETVTETFYGLCLPYTLPLGRFPIGNAVSVVENGVTIPRLILGTDAAMTSGDATLTSVLGPTGAAFVDAYVGAPITVTGAGTAGADLTTTIASITDANTIELAATAGTTVAAAAFTINYSNPAFIYVVNKGVGTVSKVLSNCVTPFTGEVVSINYTSGWLLPEDTGRNLPKGIEDACILLCQYKIQEFKSGADFSDTLRSVKIDGLGDVQFGDTAAERSNAMPFDVRSLLSRYMQPSFA